MNKAIQERILIPLNNEKYVNIHFGDNKQYLRQLPSNSIKLIITSPPYNLNKDYEKKTSMDDYLTEQAKVINECVRVLHPMEVYAGK